MHAVHQKTIRITPDFLDALDHVNYMNYVKLIGEVMFDEFRSMHGFDLPTLRDQHDIGLVLTELNAKYFQSLKLGDMVDAVLHAKLLGPKNAEFLATICKGGKTVATVCITVMSVQYSTGRSLNLPEWIVRSLLTDDVVPV
jgi:acyl-CoA thioesterase FadM